MSLAQSPRCRTCCLGKLAKHLPVIVFIAVTGVGCSDPRSAGQVGLDPSWTIEVDYATTSVLAEGRVSNGFEDVRLTEGDVLRLSWAGRYRQLYRTNAPFVYSRVFPIPAGNNSFEARFDRSESHLDPVVINVVVPELQSTMLVEENMSLAETGTLNLSWDLGSAPVSLVGQAVRSRILDCATAVTESDTRTVNIDNAARSISLDLQSLPRPSPAGSRSCRYSIQLLVSTFVDKPGSVALQTRSRLFETSIDFTGSP